MSLSGILLINLLRTVTLKNIDMFMNSEVTKSSLIFIEVLPAREAMFSW